MKISQAIYQFFRAIVPAVDSTKRASISRCERRLAYSAVPFVSDMHDLFAQGDIDANHDDTMVSASAMTSSLITPADMMAAASNTPVAVSPAIENVLMQATAAHNQTGLTHAQQAFGLSGAGQTIAVIDSGIAYNHDHLGGGFGAAYRVVGGYDFAENDSNPYDDAPAGFHGTGVAGVIGGSGTTNPGVATGVDFVALRVFDDYGSGTLANVERALQWVHQNRNAFENPITTVNLSLGTNWNSDSVPNGAILEDEFAQLRADGILVVVAAGNSFQSYLTPGLSYPAASPYVLPVASVDSDGNLSDFSQRNDRVLAAPGRAITTTVPDELYGADGKRNDYSTMSGTSFAAPYVAGASALVREALQIVGAANVSIDTITNALFNAADSVYDAVTHANYDRLNIYKALDAILPNDQVGDTLQAATLIGNGQTNGVVAGFINHLGDKDVYQWHATQAGTFSLNFDSNRLLDSDWLSFESGLQQSADVNGTLSFTVQAGEVLSFGISDADQIGAFNLNWNFVASAGSGEGTIGIELANAVDLGDASTQTHSVAGSGLYAVNTIHDGLMTFQVDGVAGASRITVYDAQGQLITADQSVVNGQLRIDFSVQDNESYYIAIESNSSTVSLSTANALTVDGTSLTVTGSHAADIWEISLAAGIRVDLGAIEYSFTTTEIKTIDLQQGQGSDQLVLRGSTSSEAVYLNADHGSLTSNLTSIVWSGSEKVTFNGGSFDRVYAYDTDGDDNLTIKPNYFNLRGAGYEFTVDGANRLYVDASRGGNDRATLYDSVGDDRLSMRPQFSSISGNGYFNYVTGFERVFAYANAGGNDTAALYDSVGNDSFNTNGDIASLVGAGFNSYTRYFENVEAIASAGGNDSAAIYAPQNAKTLSGADFVSFELANWSRTARGFDSNNVTAMSESTVLTNASHVADAMPSNVQDDIASDAAVVIDVNDSHVVANQFDSLCLDTTPMRAEQFERPENRVEDHTPTQRWLTEDYESAAILQRLDALTYALLDRSYEKESLASIFAEMGKETDEAAV